MKKKLMQITDNTFNELLNNEIVMPSNYFQCFDKNAKKIELDIKDENFESEIGEIMAQELNEINTYANQVMKKIKTASSITNKASQAIKEKDEKVLDNLYVQMNELQQELEKITNIVFVDFLTKAKNRKWLTHNYLTNNMKFKSKTTTVFIDVKDYDYICSNYNKLLADNLLIFICDYFMNELKKENIKFEIVRFLNNKFLIFIDENHLDEIRNVITNLTEILFSKTLKSRAGVIIKPVFNYSIKQLKKGDVFQEVLEELLQA